ncbi:Mono(ADP-ribosyl)transferase SpvB [compost metagenome]
MSEHQSIGITPPSLPKGGGAIQSIGKSWGQVGTTGAATFTIPLPISPGRGYAPSLSLNYQSAVGNSSFGLGWNLSLGHIAKRTSNGVPTYTDEDEIIGPGGDVWLPERDASGTIKHTIVRHYNGLDLGVDYQVIRHFARVEGAFDLIEHWRLNAQDPGFWLIHGADGSLHMYGKTTRTADPDNAMHVAQWLLEESMNAHGEHILYQYQAEDLAGLAADHPRDFRAQHYLSRVRYGNAQPWPSLHLWDETSLEQQQWHFDLLLDYGQRSTQLDDKPPYHADRGWPVRSDPHSSFAYGFELGTLRLCQQVLMFHHFPNELGDAPVMTQRLVLNYESTDLSYSQLIAAHSQAYAANDKQDQLPPMHFRYAPFDTGERRYHTFDNMAGLNDGQHYQLVDLYGDGLPGVLYRSDKCWYYREPQRAELAPQGNEVDYRAWQTLPRIPNADSSSPTRQSLGDLNGDGRLDWIVAQPGHSGFFTLNPDRSWSSFAPFAAFPVEFFQAQGQLADLIGAGLSDLALIGTRSVRLYANRRDHGFASATEVAHNDDALPLISNSRAELVAFSDVLGSGQQHLIRIRHNEIRCWPNRGRGRFGKGFRLCQLPFDHAEFDASRVLLADLDGSGAADLIYLKAGHIEVFMNHCGNGLATSPQVFEWPAGVRYDNLCQVSTADLQGLGCSSLVLTVPHVSPRHWRLDFTAAKPYLLNQTNNNMGAIGSVSFRSSAQEWLDEKQALLAAGQPTLSYLPFPVHVVTEQTQLDEITGNRLTQRFQYRQGYYDSHEREFRGFGLLLQYDAETSESQETGYTAPALSKTWFHTGAYPPLPTVGFDASDREAHPLRADLLSRFDPAGQTDQIITDADETTLREMARTLAGSVIRTELFGLDSGPRSKLPYAVESHRFLVRQLQPHSTQQRYAVMLPLALESISYQYERQPDDPRCQHSINLAWDRFGSTTHAATVSYARRRRVTDTPPFEEEHQQTWWRASHDEAQHNFYLSESRSQAIHLDNRQAWRLGLPYRQRSNALVLPATRLAPNEISYEHFIAAEGPLNANAERVLAGQSIQRYQQAAEGHATFEALADYQEIAELDDTALQAYERVMSGEELQAKLLELGYARMPAFLPDQDDLTLWSVKRGFATYAPAEQFFKVVAFRETRSHGLTLVEHDPYHCLVSRVTLPDGCMTQASHDYRTLQPLRIVDPNQNTQQALYDGFGRLLASSFYGTERGEAVGFDPLETYQRPFESPTEAIADPAQALHNAATAYFYDAFSWMQAPETRQPVHSVMLQADRYPGDPEVQIRIGLNCADGFGRDLQSKQRVEPGQAYAVNEQGELRIENDQPVMVDAATRWRVSERVEYNNKGLPIRVYRPYFADQWRYINDASFRLFGYSDQQFYDPLGRGTRTFTAKGYLRRETYLTWYSISEDENDTYEEVMANENASVTLEP